MTPAEFHQALLEDAEKGRELLQAGAVCKEEEPGREVLLARGSAMNQNVTVELSGQIEVSRLRGDLHLFFTDKYLDDCVLIVMTEAEWSTFLAARDLPDDVYQLGTGRQRRLTASEYKVTAKCEPSYSRVTMAFDGRFDHIDNMLKASRVGKPLSQAQRLGRLLGGGVPDDPVLEETFVPDRECVPIVSAALQSSSPLTVLYVTDLLYPYLADIAPGFLGSCLIPTVDTYQFSKQGQAFLDRRLAMLAELPDQEIESRLVQDLHRLTDLCQLQRRLETLTVIRPKLACPAVLALLPALRGSEEPRWKVQGAMDAALTLLKTVPEFWQQAKQAVIAETSQPAGPGQRSGAAAAKQPPSAPASPRKPFEAIRSFFRRS